MISIKKVLPIKSIHKNNIFYNCNCTFKDVDI